MLNRDLILYTKAISACLSCQNVRMTKELVDKKGLR